MDDWIKYPITPKEALEKYSLYLTNLELEEIKNYKIIYYLGEKWSKKTCYIRAKKRMNDIEQCPNFEKNGNFAFYVNAHIKYQYEMLYSIAQGGFSHVIRAFDHKTSAEVAIKIFKSINSISKYYSHEVQMLTAANDVPECENGVVKIIDKFEFRNSYFIALELMVCDLAELIELRPKGLPKHDVVLIVQDICRILEVLHRNEILHLDLKPNNIGFKETDRRLTLLDFGLSEFADNVENCEIIQTLGFQSPEVIFGGTVFSAADMWTVGCITSQLCTGNNLFRSDSEYDQFASVVELLGMPPESFLENCSATKYSKFIREDGHPYYCDVTIANGKPIYYQRLNTNYSFDIGPPNSKRFAKFFYQKGNRVILDFIQKCLSWEPHKRLTAKEALEHDFLRPHFSSIFSSTPSTSFSDPLSTYEIETLNFYIRHHT